MDGAVQAGPTGVSGSGYNGKRKILREAGRAAAETFLALSMNSSYISVAPGFPAGRENPCSRRRPQRRPAVKAVAGRFARPHLAKGAPVNANPPAPPISGSSGERMSVSANSYAPSREDFSALLNETYGEDEAFEGSVVKGKVVAIEKDMAIIDCGLKTEGRVALKEFTNHGRDPAPAVGDEVEVYLERIENALGEAVISRDKARREESWVKLEQAFEKNEKVDGVIFNQVKGGFTVDLDGAVAFLPRSQVDIRPVRDVAPLMNVPQPFQILKMDRRRGNIVVSRRTVLEESRAEQRHEIVANLAEGQVIDGTVKNITDYGAFVDLGGIDGLLHVTDIAWRRVNHPTEVLSIGQTVKVKIIKINHETHRISLGMKQLLEDPWAAIESKYQVGMRLKGRVTNITDYGAFVELEPGIEGLIHVSEMSWTKKNVHPGKIIATSQEVDVQVLEVDSAKRRISLGLKQTLQNPWEAFAEKHPIGSRSRARSRTRPNSVCSSAWTAMSTAWSISPTSTGIVLASR